MSSFNFLERKNTDSTKWNPEGMKNMVSYVDDESIPMWVADMDFKTVPLLLENLKKRIEHGCFGYSMPDEAYYDAIKYWYNKHYSFNIEKNWIITTPGIVPAIAYLVQSFTKEGEGVIIQEPVYYPFRIVIESNSRVVVNNNLIEKDGKYFIDFDDLKEKASHSNNKLMILCSPHNPLGRVWTKDELEKIAQICYDNNIILCSDEIHSDLILFNNKFETCGNLPKHLLENTIICTAPSKTFNLAALPTSNLIIVNCEFRETLSSFLTKIRVSGKPSMFGNIAVQSVYNKEGEKWLKELLAILEDNFNYVKSFFSSTNINVIELQGTYLVWLDFRNTSLDWTQIEHKMEKEAKVVLDPGSKFGKAGKGFMRINIACHKSTLKEALERIKKVYDL